MNDPCVADIDELHRQQGRHYADLVFARCIGDPECSSNLVDRLANAVLANVIGEVQDIYRDEGVDPGGIDSATTVIREAYIERLRTLIIAAETPTWA